MSCVECRGRAAALGRVDRSARPGSKTAGDQRHHHDACGARGCTAPGRRQLIADERACEGSGSRRSAPITAGWTSTCHCSKPAVTALAAAHRRKPADAGRPPATGACTRIAYELRAGIGASSPPMTKPVIPAVGPRRGHERPEHAAAPTAMPATSPPVCARIVTPSPPSARARPPVTQTIATTWLALILRIGRPPPSRCRTRASDCRGGIPRRRATIIRSSGVFAWPCA